MFAVSLYNYSVCFSVIVSTKSNTSMSIQQLLEPGEPMVPGRIRDSNRTTLIAQLREHGYQYMDLGIAKDT